jgi:hypothetical protein
VRSYALGAFERKITVERRSARSNVVLVIPQFAVGFHRFQAAPSLFAAIERSLCDRTHSVEFLPINKTLGHLVEGKFLGAFLESILLLLCLFFPFYL